MGSVYFFSSDTMTKGTSSFGKRNGRSHTLCKRCGNRSWAIQTQKCASCGYPSAKTRGYAWSEKANRRRTQGSGRMTHMKKVFKLAARKQKEDEAGPHIKVKHNGNRKSFDGKKAKEAKA